ncbi:hypothetical protein, partial [Escherichia coli]|uniref:hypothetical protein n=1 Tax=Escherichia coli TaxID=562 RepID=UPI00201A47F9
SKTPSYTKSVSWQHHLAIHHKHYKTVETYYAAINAISQSLSFSADEIKTYL